jgi:hypothetical protein
MCLGLPQSKVPSLGLEFRFRGPHFRAQRLRSRFTLLSRSAPRAGLVPFRQTFVCRCHCLAAVRSATQVRCQRRPRTHGRKRPRPLELGGEPGRGLSLQSGSNIGLRSLCMWERCWRKREPFSLSHIIGPIPLSRSDPLPGICSIAPEICSMRPSRWGVLAASQTWLLSRLAPHRPALRIVERCRLSGANRKCSARYEPYRS